MLPNGYPITPKKSHLKKAQKNRRGDLLENFQGSQLSSHQNLILKVSRDEGISPYRKGENTGDFTQKWWKLMASTWFKLKMVDFHIETWCSLGVGRRERGEIDGQWVDLRNIWRRKSGFDKPMWGCYHRNWQQQQNHGNARKISSHLLT